MRGLVVRLLLFVAGLTAASLAGPVVASGAGGYYITFAARDCPTYGDIYANKARNDIVESLVDLGPNTQYGNSGALVGPAYENTAPQTECKPLAGWKFTMGTGYVTRAVTGKWGSMSKVTGPYSSSIVTQESTPLLDNHGDPLGSQTIPGAVTIKLTQAQATQASKSSSLWVQGGTPNDPVLASQFGTPEAPDYGFGTLRCATDNVNGDNVEYAFFPSGTNHIFCYAYYVSPPPTSGTIIIRKQVVGAPAGSSPSFPFSGDLSFDPGGFTLKNGQATSFYRAGGETWSLTEESVDGYRLGAVNCTSASGASTTARNGSMLSIDLSASDTVECTFVNERIPPTGSLAIAKITEGGVGGPFQFLVSPGQGEGLLARATTSIESMPSDASPANPEASLQALPPGSYTITESRPVDPGGGWTLVSAECDGSARSTRDVTITVAPGQHQSCTFTNRLSPGGAIKLSKVTEGGSGATAFVIESLGDQPIQFHQDAVTTNSGEAVDAVPASAADSTEHIYLGQYRIIEKPPLNSSAEEEWMLTSVVCDGADTPFSNGSIVVTLNRVSPHADCRFTNTLTKTPPDPEPAEPADPTPPTTEPPAIVPGEPTGPVPPTIQPETPGTGGAMEIPQSIAQPDATTKPEGKTPEPDDIWANLSISTKPLHTLVHLGQRITDTVRVTNRGPSDAEDTVLDYQAQQGTRLASVKTPQGTCSRELPLSCDLGLLKAGHTVTLMLILLPAKHKGDFVMHSTVGSSTYDPELSDNASRELAYVESALPPLPPPCLLPATPLQNSSPAAHAAC